MRSIINQSIFKDVLGKHTFTEKCFLGKISQEYNFIYLVSFLKKNTRENQYAKKLIKKFKEIVKVYLFSFAPFTNSVELKS